MQLTFRRFQAGDLPDFRSWFADPECTPPVLSMRSMVRSYEWWSIAMLGSTRHRDDGGSDPCSAWRGNVHRLTRGNPAPRVSSPGSRGTRPTGWPESRRDARREPACWRAAGTFGCVSRSHAQERLARGAQGRRGGPNFWTKRSGICWISSTLKSSTRIPDPSATLTTALKDAIAPAASTRASGPSVSNTALRARFSRSLSSPRAASTNSPSRSP